MKNGLLVDFFSRAAGGCDRVLLDSREKREALSGAAMRTAEFYGSEAGRQAGHLLSVNSD